MPIAAAPDYLGGDYSTASPGQRFGMYLELWGVNSRTKKTLWTTHDVNYRRTGRDRQEREFHDENKTHAINRASNLTRFDKSAMVALASRQQAIADSISKRGRATFLADAVAPFTTGLGNEYPLENGFAFLNPYGLPYLPGSGVKGVVRRAALELASGEWGDTGGWDGEDVFAIEVSGKSLPPLSTIDVLFGREPPSGDQHHIRGALSFWDVVPQVKGGSLSVEIMTPHQGHYYQQGESPHDSGQPNPISFLTVPPGSRFTFHVTCSRGHLERHAPELLRDDRWKALLEAAFAHAFEWLGFGAKTAVGYGAMEIDPRVEEAERRQVAEDAARQARQEEERQRREAEEADEARRRAEQAAFDALPESRRLLIKAVRTLDAISSSDRTDENRRNEVKALANRLADKAPAWSHADEREEAALLLERLYAVIGWSNPGLKKKQREKQIKKRSDAIARIRDVRDAPP